MSAGGGPAIQRLLRLLHVIPAARREGGVTYRELAAELGTTPETVETDVRELLDRSAYLEARHAGQIMAQLDAEGVEIWAPGPFDRPPRLTKGEALALVLGLRSRALLRGRPPGREAGPLLERLEAVLASDPPDAAELPVEDGSAPAPGARLRDAALDAVADHRVVELRYLKPTDPEPATRRLEPAAVVHAEGRWYLVGRIPGDRGSAGGSGGPPTGGEEASGGEVGAAAHEDLRAFRFDRILELRRTEDDFEPLPDLEIERITSGPGMFVAPDEAEEVPVRYAPTIARWIRERYEGEALPDGAFRVVHAVADRGWLVRHVLLYGGEARAEGPAAAWVRRALAADGPGG